MRQHICFIVIVILLLLFLYFNKRILSNNENFRCSYNNPKCPHRTKYQISSMYNPSLMAKMLQPNDNITPYYERSWSECLPCGENHNTCADQAYVGVPDGPEVLEKYDNFPRNTLSCSPSCTSEGSFCANNPYGENYDDPRWLNYRFWNEQENAPGMRDLGGWYPKPNITS